MEKTLRYLLIAVAVMAVLSVSAQSLAQEPQIGFQSTSSMVGSGSTLPQAAQTGTYTTYDQGYSASRANKPGMRRDETGFGGDDDDDPDKPGSDRPEMWENPIGDGVWVLMVLAAAFMVRVYLRRRRA